MKARLTKVRLATATWHKWGHNGAHGLWHLSDSSGMRAEVERCFGSKPGKRGGWVQDRDAWVYAVRLVVDGRMVEVDLPSWMWRRKIPIRDVKRWVEVVVRTMRPAPVLGGVA